MGLLLDCETSELMFRLEGNKQLSSSIKLRNTTENHVAFKVLCTKRRQYGVQPWIGVLSPGGSCEVTVKTQAPRRAPTSMQTWQGRDIFKIQSVLARPGTTKEDAPNLFNTAVAHMIEESKLQVVYTLPQAQVATFDAHNLRGSLATSKVDEPGSIVEASPSQVIQISVRDRNINRVGGWILMCFIGTFIVVVSYYLMKQTCSLIWTLMESMVMLMMKMVTKLVSESIEDWVAKTVICVFMSFVYKYEERLRHIMLRVWDQVLGLTNREIMFIEILTN
ncbi:vesicle-associated protein 1-2-like [Primulina eburnea]|uniref:vesicle-associated protein 1-2-like n=1 Tax=Primulina eburnea TaxID=1245227 RepID=UPI003C6C0159